MAGNENSIKTIKVDIRDVERIYESSRGPVKALNHINLQIYENEFVCVVGPSGCGKSTLLNIMAGLDKATKGEILVDGERVEEPSTERGVIFQQYALFPWLTVKKNIMYGLKNKKMTREQAGRAADKYIKMVGLDEFSSSYPKELSGGMKQRVAIARAFAMNPKLLLLDEPFGALDAQTRAQLQSDLLDTWEQEQKTCFFITHDVEEAVLLAQRVVIMSSRPARIKRIVDIDIPYPRTQETKMDSRFMELKNEIWSEVYTEYLAQKK
ncbi:nitrate ABC transporter ATP-binding protein [Clostridium sp. chh4-2]|uniref:ABC transporter ATP-binding protein n=1 Tax=Clostridium sp. chh4-2 TaxID=2067550 RepID=UPI000CCFC9A4|nr:ABC transporter ATP-binding protein [Clostridium sp. chh4-2]PNV59820.1 nitrate ABC transporter ATP-binding protein [Clostridium sp. chh4-2]